MSGTGLGRIGPANSGRKRKTNHMKQTMTTYDIADELRRDENANWSPAGALALAEYLEELEADTGEEMEFDRVAIRCDFSEYKSLREWAEEYFGWWPEWASKIGLDAEATPEEVKATDDPPVVPDPVDPQLKSDDGNE